MATVTESPKKKRRSQWYHSNAALPICPTHHVLCWCDHTDVAEDGSKIQFRYCTVDGCDYSVKTPIPAPQSSTTEKK